MVLGTAEKFINEHHQGPKTLHRLFEKFQSLKDKRRPLSDHLIKGRSSESTKQIMASLPELELANAVYQGNDKQGEINKTANAALMTNDKELYIKAARKIIEDYDKRREAEETPETRALREARRKEINDKAAATRKKNKEAKAKENKDSEEENNVLTPIVVTADILNLPNNEIPTVAEERGMFNHLILVLEYWQLYIDYLK